MQHVVVVATIVLALGFTGPGVFAQTASSDAAFLAVSAAWQDACGSSDEMVLVTAEQLSAMREEIGDVVGRYRRVGMGNPEAKRIAVYLFAYALDLDKAPAR